MNISTIGAQRIIKDTNSVGLIESGLPKITYPWSYTTEYFFIEQQFVCDADKVPTFIHSIPHSKYPKSKSVSQTGAEIITTGLARFSRRYVQFPSNPIQQASTATVTFPPIAFGINYQGRGITTVEEEYQTPAGYAYDSEGKLIGNITNPDGSIAMVTKTREVPAITNWYRKNSVSKVIPVISETSFVYMGSSLEKTYISAKGITVGTRMGNEIVSSVSYDSENQRYNVSYESGKSSSFGSSALIQVLVPVYKISSISVDEPFKIVDQYSTYKGAEVEFIDDLTLPSRTSFLESTNNNKLLFASQINHIEGYLYTKNNIYGKIE